MKLTHETRPVFELAWKLTCNPELLRTIQQCISDCDAFWSWPVQCQKYTEEQVLAAVGVVDAASSKRGDE